jgi:hypothetical protein
MLIGSWTSRRLTPVSIFTKPLADITIDDITGFLSLKEPEGQRVEYKTEFPQKNEEFAKSIAALANTEGGVMLIGVEVDAQNRPIKLEGIPSSNQLHDRVVNICASRIRPRILPEIKVLDMPESKDHSVVFIRIPQSIQAPHQLLSYDGEPLIPLRMGAKAVRADLTAIENLLRQREGSSLTRKRAAGLSYHHTTLHEVSRVAGIQLTEKEAFQIHIKVLALWGSERLCGFNHELDDFLLNNLPYESPLGGKPTSDIFKRKVTADKGFVASLSQDAVKFQSVGLTSDKRPICLQVRITETGAIQFAALIMRDDFRLSVLTNHLRDTILLAGKLFDRIDYHGEFGVDILLENVWNTTMRFGSMGTFEIREPQHIQVYETFHTDIMADSLSELAKIMLRRVLREANIPASEQTLDEIAADMFPRG